MSKVMWAGVVCVAASASVGRADGGYEGVQGRTSANLITIPNSSTWTPLPFTITDSASPGATLGTVTSAGVYDLSSTIEFQSNFGVVAARLLVNGVAADSFYFQGQTSGAWNQASLSAVRALQPGDTYSVQLYGSGTTALVAGGAGSYSSLTATHAPGETAVQARSATPYTTVPASNNWTTVPFTAGEFASPGAVAGVATTPGVYRLNAGLTFQANPGISEGRLLVNGTQVDSFYLAGSTNNSWTEVSLAAFRSLQPGDTYSVQVRTSSGQMTVASSPSDYSGLTASSAPSFEGVQARLSTNFLTVPGNNTWTTLPFTTPEFATPGATAGTAWENGLYDLTATIALTSPGTNVQGRLLVNGVQVDSFYLLGALNGTWIQGTLSALRTLSAGDTYVVQILNPGGSSINVASSAGSFSELTATIVPEPTALFGGLAVAAAGMLRRRRAAR